MKYYYYGPKCKNKKCGRRIAVAEQEYATDGSPLTMVWSSEPFVATCEVCKGAFEYDKGDPDSTAMFALDERIKDFHTHPSFKSVHPRP